MAWVKIDDQFADHPKIREVGPVGMAIQVSALCYCNRFLTDGFISNQAATAIILGLSKEKNWPEKMVSCGLWVKHEHGFIINDYLEYNPSKNEVLELRNQRKSAAKRGAESTNEKRWGTPKESANPSPKESASRRPCSEPSSDDNVIAPLPLPLPLPNSNHPAFPSFPPTPNGSPTNREGGPEPERQEGKAEVQGRPRLQTGKLITKLDAGLITNCIPKLIETNHEPTDDLNEWCEKFEEILQSPDQTQLSQLRAKLTTCIKKNVDLYPVFADLQAFIEDGKSTNPNGLILNRLNKEASQRSP